MSHTLRAALFFLPVQMFISGLLLWGGWRAVRTREFGVQVLLTVLSVGWVWIQLKHGLVI